MISLKSLVDDAETQNPAARPRNAARTFSAILSDLTGASVHLKLENLQRTGSFKVRGAFNRLLSLDERERVRGIVAASSGNHGAAVALGDGHHRNRGHRLRAQIRRRARKSRRSGGSVRTSALRARKAARPNSFARSYAAEHHMTYVSPYNDEAVIAGQGTIGAELIRQLPAIDAVVASIGGGGLMSGIAGYLKAVNPDVVAIGVFRSEFERDGGVGPRRPGQSKPRISTRCRTAPRAASNPAPSRSTTAGRSSTSSSMWTKAISDPRFASSSSRTRCCARAQPRSRSPGS